jgi:serine/threonine protein kinase
MLCGYLPFEDIDTAILYKTILKGDFEIPEWLSPTSISILKGLMCVDPISRLTLSEIGKHPFIAKYMPETTKHNLSLFYNPESV